MARGKTFRSRAHFSTLLEKRWEFGAGGGSFTHEAAARQRLPDA